MEASTLNPARLRLVMEDTILLFCYNAILLASPTNVKDVKMGKR